MANEFLQDCEKKLSVLYQKLVLEPHLKACEGLEFDPWISLRFFLSGYAFERQGRSPDYAAVAFDALEEIRLDGDPSRRTASEVWRNFKAKLGKVGANYTNNPLCPRGQVYRRKRKGSVGKFRVKKVSAIELVFDKLEGQCMVAWAKKCLEKDDTASAHKTLKQINGVGQKISSFFLRDIATINAIAPAKDRPLLQPVDTWIHFVAETLSEQPKLDDAGCADFFVTNSQCPERANQGAWYFCAKVAQSSQYKVGKSITDVQYRRGLIQDHLDGLVATGKAAELAQSACHKNVNLAQA